MHLITLFPHSTWLKERGALPVRTVPGLLIAYVVKSLSLHAAVKQLLQRLSVHPAGDDLPIDKGGKHGRLQESGQEVQVGCWLNWEEWTLKTMKATRF